jgi:hypothetical protein
MNRASRWLIALALLAAVAAYVPASGSAGGDSRCPVGRLCVWSDPGYEGQKVVIKRRKLSHKLFNQMNDQASSLKLRKSGVAVLYMHVTAEGAFVCFDGPRHNQRDLADVGFDNTASSSTIVSGEGPC